MSGHNTPWANCEELSTTAPLEENLRTGLAILWQAYTYATDAGAELWDFALEIDKLYATGLTISDLRWLVAKGFAEHGREMSVYGDSHRSFRPSDGFNFENETCLVLTPNGARLASNILSEPAGGGLSTWPIDLASHVRAKSPSLKPCWDPTRRELSLAGIPVKRFRVPARNQELILSAFEEDGWPIQIDDPLPVSDDIDPRTRLHDAINRLNGHQTNNLLSFHGDGHGTGVSWEHRHSELPQATRESPQTHL